MWKQHFKLISSMVLCYVWKKIARQHNFDEYIIEELFLTCKSQSLNFFRGQSCIHSYSWSWLQDLVAKILCLIFQTIKNLDFTGKTARFPGLNLELQYQSHLLGYWSCIIISRKAWILHLNSILENIQKGKKSSIFSIFPHCLTKPVTVTLLLGW